MKLNFYQAWHFHYIAKIRSLRQTYFAGDRIVFKGDFEAFKGKDGKELMSFKISEIVSAERGEPKPRYEDISQTDSDDVPF